MMDKYKPRFKKIGRKFFLLIKSLQTGLLLITGLTGYMSARCPVLSLNTLLGLTGSLFLAISGSTVLNMWYDRDIDAIMPRTCNRPLCTGETKPREALIFGLILSMIGISWAVSLDTLYGLIIFAGLFFVFCAQAFFWLSTNLKYHIPVSGKTELGILETYTRPDWDFKQGFHYVPVRSDGYGQTFSDDSFVSNNR